MQSLRIDIVNKYIEMARNERVRNCTAYSIAQGMTVCMQVRSASELEDDLEESIQVRFRELFVILFCVCVKLSFIDMGTLWYRGYWKL